MSKHQSYTPVGQPPDWSLVPEHTAESLRLFIEEGAHPGGFLEAVLSNDLAKSVRLAVDENRPKLADIVTFLLRHVPSEAWGSPDKFQAWIDRDGLGR